MSLDNCRNQVLSNSNEERVEVNHRLLIDKILARYSSEFVVYRELMQNSDDAKSSCIQIIFETESHEPIDKIKRIQFKNNGFVFRPEDWSRLKSIADGNPDEQKIGAFGVGFYSLFSVCENPFVSSGGKGMAFYWRGNQLFTKHGPVDDEEESDWTTFLMDMREPIEVPNIGEFTRFLANSLLFTMNLQEISLYFYDELIIHLSKKLQDPKLMNISSGFSTNSPQRMFNLTSLDVRDAQLNVRFRTEEPMSVFYRIATGYLDVKVSNAFSNAMERLTKKRPPNKTIIQMIFTGFEEHINNENVPSIFKDLIQFPNQGKVYIGFSTCQTTGCCSHLSARVIPTMERETIDMANNTLAKYNTEMLSLSGTLGRILYEDEMAQIAQIYIEKIGANAKTDDVNIKPIRELLQRRAAHALMHFTFHTSTPNEKIGKIAETQFSNCLYQKISILSTNGVTLINNVRLPHSELGFIKKVPVVPNIILEQCYIFFRRAKQNFLIKELNLDDVLYELKSRALSEDEMVNLLKWWITYRSTADVTSSIKFAQFKKFARISSNSRSLDTIRYILNSGIVPPDMDIPDDVLPYTISKSLNDPQNLKKWLEWPELPLINWAEFIVNKPALEVDPIFAEKVHQTLARNLGNTTAENKKIISRLFSQKKCVPTNFGMKTPKEAYFDSLSPDLPAIQFQKPRSVKNLMELLGVRKVIELDFILNQLNNQDGQERLNHKQLIKYLVSMTDDLKANEIGILKMKPVWPKERSMDPQPNKNELEENNSREYFIAKDLYVPLAIHREFGLPIIEWRGKFSHNSPEGKILLKLGLQEYPTLDKILELAASPTDPYIRSRALGYFIDNFEKKYKEKNYNSDRINIEFLPCSESNVYAKPSECFINPECMIMNFKVVNQELKFQVEKLGVRQNPGREKLLSNLMQQPPKDENEGKKIFEYLASQLTHFNSIDWDKLSKFKFIPIRNKTTNEVILVNSSSCFFKEQDTMFDGLFSHVNFGEIANKFLQSCKIKDEPSLIDITKLLIKSSHKLWESIGSDVEKYKKILKDIGNNFTKILTEDFKLLPEMKKEPILIAIKKDNDKKVDRYSLASANEIFMNDNIVYREIFNPLVAPEDVLLETLYKELGCKSLRGSVKETSIPKGTIQETEKSQQLQETIRKRAGLFYYNQPKQKIVKGEEWLKKLKVREVDCIETTYTLGNAKGEKMIKENDTYILREEFSADSWTLYITSKSEPLSISKQMAKNIFNSSIDEWNSMFCINTLLTTPLESLKSLGYPVDRILKSEMQILKNDELITERRDLNNVDTSNSSHDSNSSSHKSNDSSHNTFLPQSSIDLDDSSNSSQDSSSFHSKIKLTNKKQINITYNSAQKIRISLQDSIKDLYSKSRKVNDNITKPNSNFNGIITYQASVEIDFDDKQIDYCEMPDHSLQHVETLQEVELYLPEGFNQSEITQEQTASLNRFIKILKDLVKVFGLTPKDIHIFYDNNTNSIAFNHNKVLFFNLKFYIGLHDEECKTKPTVNAMTYWFMLICHELAHNFVPEHNSDHEYFYLSISEIYMLNFLERAKSREIL